MAATTRALGAAAILLAKLCACEAHGARLELDEIGLVQLSTEAVLSASDEADQDYDDEEEASPSDLGRNFTSLMQIPGVKGMKEQLKEAAGFTMPKAEKGYHKKVVKALPKLQSECKSKPYATEEDCNTAVNLLTMMNKVTEGPEPLWTWHEHLRQMMGLHFWLYTPGTMLCFTILDMDKSKGITNEEMSRLFGTQVMASFNTVWKFMDPDGDGSITREELHKYLRAAILVRDVLPELDGIDPSAPTQKCLNMAHRVLSPPPAPSKKMQFYPKLLSIAGIFAGACALHCLLCTRTPRKGEHQAEQAALKASKGKDEN